MMGILLGLTFWTVAWNLRRYFRPADSIMRDILLSGLVMLAIAVLLQVPFNKSLKKFLASTDYAKSRVVAADHLRMYSFTKNRG
jgi:hypothetical protein